MRSASWPDELHHLSIGSTMTIRRTLTTVILFAVLTAGAAGCSAAQPADAPPAPSTAVVTLNTAALAAKAAAAVKAAKAKVVAAKAAAAKVAAAKARAANKRRSCAADEIRRRSRDRRPCCGAITSFAAAHRCLVGGRRRRPSSALTGRGACRGRGHTRPVGTQCRAW